MKFFAFLLLCSLSIVLVVAFPNSHAAVADLPSTGGIPNEAVNPDAEQDYMFDTPSARNPRHLLKKLFNPEPSVVVQPILIQPQPFYPNQSPFYGSGRGYVGGGFNAGLGYSKSNFGCC